MKKIWIGALCALTALALTACGGTEEIPEGVNIEPMAPVEATAEPESASPAEAASMEPLKEEDDSPSDMEEAPASPTDAPAVDEEAFAEAQACVGQSVEELYAAVGEPNEAQYAASCLEEDAEDGMLFYDDLGFYVWTVRSDSGETVHQVSILD